MEIFNSELYPYSRSLVAVEKKYLSHEYFISDLPDSLYWVAESISEIFEIRVVSFGGSNNFEQTGIQMLLEPIEGDFDGQFGGEKVSFELTNTFFFGLMDYF